MIYNIQSRPAPRNGDLITLVNCLDLLSKQLEQWTQAKTKLCHAQNKDYLVKEDSQKFGHDRLVFPFPQNNWQILTCNADHGWGKSSWKMRLSTQDGRIYKDRNSMKLLNGNLLSKSGYRICFWFCFFRLPENLSSCLCQFQDRIEWVGYKADIF